MGFYSMPKYFQEMPTIGKPLVAPKQENADALKEIEKDHNRREIKREGPVICYAENQPSYRCWHMVPVKQPFQPGR